VGGHLGQLEERRKAAEERARQADERAAQVTDRLRSAERRAGAVEGALAETESRVRQAEAEFRIASERLLAAENLPREPGPEAIAQELARFDFAPEKEGGEPYLEEEAVAAELGRGPIEDETAPDPLESLREALARSKADTVWADPEGSRDAPPEDETPSVEPDPLSESSGPVETLNEPIPEATRESPAEGAIPAAVVDGEDSETSPPSLGDETLSLTERELRQYAEQRSEFEERLREFWKDAEGGRHETSEDGEERRVPFAGIWKRDRKT
jgi:hypothetical protein